MERTSHKDISQHIFICLCLTLLYPTNAVKGWYGDIFDRDRYKGVSATEFMKEDFKDDYLATKWLIDNVEGLLSS